MTRRTSIRITGGTLITACMPVRLLGASDFWNRKPPSEWSTQEITEITSHSPWAHEVNAEFELDSDYTTNGSAGPAIGRGGAIMAPGSGTGAPAQIELGKDRNGGTRGARHREPVIVRWESALPLIEAFGVPMAAEFQDRYVLSVSGLPLGVMDRKRRGAGGDPGAEPEENTPAARQRRMIEQLQNSASLEARGREPEQPGIVRAVPRAPGTYRFGFSRELLPLAAADREVQFILRTSLMSVRARFEPKDMLYRGHLAL